MVPGFLWMASIPMSDPVDTAPAADPVTDSFEKAVADRQKTWKVKEPAKADTSRTLPALDTAAKTDDAPVSTTEAQPADTPVKAPVADESVDLPNVPPEIRSKLPTLAKEVKEWLKEKVAYEKRYKDLQAEFTPKTQIRAEAEKKAALWEALQNDPEAAKAAMDAMDRKKKGLPAQADEDDGWDFADHTSAENKAYIRKMVASAKDEAKAVAVSEVKETLRREVVEPEQRKAAIGNTIAAYASANNIPEETVVHAIQIANEHATNLGIKWTPENAANLVALGMNLITTRPNTTPAKNEPQGLSRVASPQTRGVGTTAPAIPAWKRDGAKWPRTGAEKREYLLSLDIGDVYPE